MLVLQLIKYDDDDDDSLYAVPDAQLYRERQLRYLFNLRNTLYLAISSAWYFSNPFKVINFIHVYIQTFV